MPILGDAALGRALGPPRTTPGAWVDYAVRTKGAEDVRLRISILPQAPGEGRYWLEVVSVAASGVSTAVKLRARGELSDPRNIDRMYLYVPGQSPIEVPLDQLPQRPHPSGKAGKVVRGAPERVQVPGGVFDRAEPVRAGEVRIWRAAEVPLWGLVKARTPRQTLELMGWGDSGGHSIFPPGFREEEAHGNGSESMK